MRTGVLINGLALLGAITLIGVFGYGTWHVLTSWNDTPDFQFATVEEGTVTSSVALTGISSNRARVDLTFPTNGPVEDILVEEGDEVTEGDLLATLSLRGQDEDIQAAEATLREAIAVQQELLRGPTADAREVLETTVVNARETLEQTRREQDQAVANARRTLVNSALSAFSLDSQERAPAPSLSGTYECEEFGTYELTVFRSNADSGFSARIRGLETDTIPLSFTQSVPFGSCGLRISFSESVLYNRTEWTIPIPNTNAPDYTANQNAYETARTARENRIEAAEAQLQLAIQQRDRDVAPTRSEQINQANARIEQAQSRLSQARRARSDTELLAPARGVITDIHAAIGEQVSGTPVITMARGETSYAIDVRVPEIDIANVAVGQTASVIFDAQSDETYSGSVTRISPLPTEIDGVSYFTASVILDEPPPFLRSGLNADVDIITTQKDNVPTLPIAAISGQPDQPYVRIPDGESYRKQPVSILLRGTDGFIVVEGVKVGTEVIINR